MTTSFSRRRPVLRCLTALAFGAVALTAAGCSGGGDGGGGRADAATSPAAPPPASGVPSAPATPSDAATPPASTAPSALAGGTVSLPASPGAGTTPGAAAPPTGAAPFAGTRQFVQIDKAWTDNGRTYLSVRPARKEAMTQPHEAWVIVPGQGAYTAVPLADDAQVLLAVPLGDNPQSASYSHAEFVSRLAAQPSSIRPMVGYDLSFDGEGRVTRVESLYTS